MQKIFENESRHCSIKMLVIVASLCLLVLASLFRAAGKSKASVIGVSRCDPADHAILIVLIVICLTITIFNAFWVTRMHK